MHFMWKHHDNRVRRRGDEHHCGACECYLCGNGQHHRQHFVHNNNDDLLQIHRRQYLQRELSQRTVRLQNSAELLSTVLSAVHHLRQHRRELHKPKLFAKLLFPKQLLSLAVSRQLLPFNYAATMPAVRGRLPKLLRSRSECLYQMQQRQRNSVLFAERFECLRDGLRARRVRKQLDLQVHSLQPGLRDLQYFNSLRQLSEFERNRILPE